MNVRSGNDFVSCSSNVSSSKYESPRKWVPKFSQHTSASQQPARRLSASCTNRFSPLLTPAPSSSSIADDFEKPSDTEQWSHEPLCPICYEEYDVFDFFQLECGHQFHHECLLPYVKTSKKSTCPMCRRFSLILNDIYLEDIMKHRAHAQDVWQRQRFLNDWVIQDWLSFLNFRNYLRDYFMIDNLYEEANEENRQANDTEQTLDTNHQNLADSDDDLADVDFTNTNAVALADTTANRLQHRDQSQRRRRVIGCSTLTFSGRTILSVTYIGFLFWHREKDTISSLMDDSFSRSLISTAFCLYLTSTSIAKSLNVSAASILMLLPRLVNWIFEFLVPFCLSTYYTYQVVSPFSVFVVDSLCYGICLLTGFAVTQFVFVGFFHGLHFLVSAHHTR
jgi:hypothetical protein